MAFVLLSSMSCKVFYYTCGRCRVLLLIHAALQQLSWQLQLAAVGSTLDGPFYAQAPNHQCGVYTEIQLQEGLVRK